MTVWNRPLFLYFLLAVFLLFALTSLSISPAARTVPAGCAAVGFALSLLLLRKEKAPPKSGHRGAREAVSTLLIVSGVAAVAGMLAMAPASYLAYALVSGGARDWRRMAVAAAVATLAAYLLFGILLQVPLARTLP